MMPTVVWTVIGTILLGLSIAQGNLPLAIFGAFALFFGWCEYVNEPTD